MAVIDLDTTIQQCAGGLPPAIVRAIVSTESGFNPYAIGVVHGRLVRQPNNLAEAVATAVMLHQRGYNFSLGLGQVNKYNLKAHGLNYQTVFNPCNNIRAASRILMSCYQGALKRFGNKDQALSAAFSCYYSGNFKTGFRPDFKGQLSYVQKVTNNLQKGNYYQQRKPTQQSQPQTQRVKARMNLATMPVVQKEATSIQTTESKLLF
ncbi:MULTISPECIES: lytic transglycosylase domain-containing protein [Snodgrassella]|uniref:lytic transglycosylase domain-containing protein n=1 Tax=Snodgrassella TaxID=1193515 RepID=UPI0008154579|nr:MULTISPECIES: lytic transglycosylase domain-containing protein [Snodgrassella]MCO6521223.1 lytic transglycosylase domain-containing protein [Snodgrassella sp.]SCC04184.1 Transglycosylase SLT domain-containing protein [Snodgrassella sp. R-53583]